MNSSYSPTVAIVDYGMGNLFSVKHACDHVGLRGMVTSEKRDILSANAVILPGVGAFGDAMKALEKLDLLGPLREVAESERPLLAICLGLQLLMEESPEFGSHRGLGIVPGHVARFSNLDSAGERFKVPQVGWNRISRVSGDLQATSEAWSTSPLKGISSGEFMYFVHSYYVVPSDSSVVMTTTTYGDGEFCSSLRKRNIFACQFHPERSGGAGLSIYRNLASTLNARPCQEV